jgi:hypothetical protein
MSGPQWNRFAKLLVNWLLWKSQAHSRFPRQFRSSKTVVYQVPFVKTHYIGQNIGITYLSRNFSMIKLVTSIICSYLKANNIVITHEMHVTQISLFKIFIFVTNSPPISKVRPQKWTVTGVRWKINCIYAETRLVNEFKWIKITKLWHRETLNAWVPAYLPTWKLSDVFSFSKAIGVSSILHSLYNSPHTYLIICII